MVLTFFREVSRRHTALKERIHAFRIPLPKWGQRVMGFVYFTIPVIGGYYVMQYAIGQSEVNIGARGEKVQRRDEGKKQMGAVLKNGMVKP